MQERQLLFMKSEEDVMKQLIEQWRQAHRVVCMTGAGVSAASGLGTFQSIGERYFNMMPEEISTRKFMVEEPELFYQFYREMFYHPHVQPNENHLILRELEQRNKFHGIITQNIDGLHQMAGSKNIIELHGNAKKFYCPHCGKKYSWEVLKNGGVPRCKCSYMIYPDIVFYDDEVPGNVQQRAEHWLDKTDLLVIMGTSLSAYSALALVEEYAQTHDDSIYIIDIQNAAPFGIGHFIENSCEEALSFIAEALVS